MGVLMALDPIIAQALGARDELAVARGLQRGLVLAVAARDPDLAADAAGRGRCCALVGSPAA